MNKKINIELTLKSGDVLVINGKRYVVGDWVVGDGFNLTGIEYLYQQEKNQIKN